MRERQQSRPPPFKLTTLAHLCFVDFGEGCVISVTLEQFMLRLRFARHARRGGRPDIANIVARMTDREWLEVTLPAIREARDLFPAPHLINGPAARERKSVWGMMI